MGTGGSRRSASGGSASMARCCLRWTPPGMMVEELGWGPVRHGVLYDRGQEHNSQASWDRWQDGRLCEHWNCLTAAPALQVQLPVFRLCLTCSAHTQVSTRSPGLHPVTTTAHLYFYTCICRLLVVSIKRTVSTLTGTLFPSPPPSESLFTRRAQ